MYFARPFPKSKIKIFSKKFICPEGETAKCLFQKRSQFSCKTYCFDRRKLLRYLFVAFPVLLLLLNRCERSTLRAKITRHPLSYRSNCHTPANINVEYILIPADVTGRLCHSPLSASSNRNARTGPVKMYIISVLQESRSQKGDSPIEFPGPEEAAPAKRGAKGAARQSKLSRARVCTRPGRGANKKAGPRRHVRPAAPFAQIGWPRALEPRN